MPGDEIKQLEMMYVHNLPNGRKHRWARKQSGRGQFNIGDLGALFLISGMRQSSSGPLSLLGLLLCAVTFLVPGCASTPMPGHPANHIIRANHEGLAID